MDITVAIMVAFLATFSVIWLLTEYVPLIMTVGPITFSPRLLIAKLVAPFDAFVTIFLIVGTWFGLTFIQGIAMTVYSVLTAFGLSIGVLIIRKFLRPRWEIEYKLLRGEK